MTALDDLPNVDSFFGIDLKTGSMIIAAIGVVHPMAYGCSFFLPISYLFVTIWLLVALYFAASVVLFIGIVKDDELLCSIWLWYAVIFVGLMMMMMTLLALVFTSRKQRNRVFIVIMGMLWYILSVYFIIVVNSYRKQMQNNPKENVTDITTDFTTSDVTPEDVIKYSEKIAAPDLPVNELANITLNLSLNNVTFMRS